MKKFLLNKLIIFIILFCAIIFVNSETKVFAKQEYEDENVYKILTTENSQSELPEDNTDIDTTPVEDQIYKDLIEGGFELIPRTDIEDVKLYSALLQVAKNYIQTTYNYNYTETVIYSKMFRYVDTISIEYMNISSLQGLEQIDFANLTSLSIVGNNITDVKKGFFENMPKLQTLNLPCNNIVSVDLTGANALKNLNLSSNNLNKIDLSMLKIQDLSINIANNNIQSIKHIILPTRINSINLNLISNNISDITDDYFDYSKLTMNLGIQGLKSDENIVQIDTSNKLKIYQINMENVAIKIFKVNELEDVLVDTINSNDITENYVEIELGVGKYYFEYQINDSPLYIKNDPEKDYFKNYYFQVIPKICVFKYEYKGKIYDTFEQKVTGKVKVMLECEEGGEIYYKVNNQSDWQKGNEILCDKGGNYNITAKVIIDGVESKEVTTVIRTSLNTVISDGLMLILILLFTLTLFLIIVPLVSKKWFRK